MAHINSVRDINVNRKNKISNRVNTRGINLLELLIVIVIIAILAALAIPTFTKTVETARDKEAWTNLRLIRTGEKIYRLENPYYYPYPEGTIESDTPDINANLKLQLDPERDWDYSVTSAADNFTGRATRDDTVPNPPPSGWEGTWRIQKEGQITQEPGGHRPSPNP